MQAFAALLDALSYQPARNAKLRLIETYLKETPDPDRGWALAALTSGLDFPAAKPALLRGFGEDKIGPELFHLSYDYVGDLAETLSLIWETDPDAGPPPTLGEVVDTLQTATKMQTPAILKRWLDSLDATGRWALLKLLTGALRVGVSARLAKQAVANIGNQPVDAVEEIWHGLSPPYRPLFDWLLHDAPRPSSNAGGAFLPPMLANPIERAELDAFDPTHFRAEWKWDGIRVQVAASGGVKRLYSRAGEDVSAAFPDIIEAIDFEGVFDGELLVRREETVAPFNDLQQRLNRKVVTPKMLKDHPAHVRLYDVLWLEGEDLRALTLRPAPRPAGSLERREAQAALRRLAAGDLHRLGPSRPVARADDQRRHRGPDAEARRQRLSRRPAQGPVVQMEARSHAGRLRADVRPARPRQAQLLLLRLHLRLLARGGAASASWRRSARPISASPTRSCAGSTSGSATIRPTASGRCARCRPSWSWRSPSTASPARPATNRGWPCGSRESTASGPTNRPPRPTQ